MPLMKCQTNGKQGWKWGNSGHCYTGPDAEKMAAKQAAAIKAADEIGKPIADCYNVNDFKDAP